MIWFNKSKQHGFVRTDDGERLRVDQTGFAAGQVPEGRCGGTRVSFDRTGVDQEEARAVNVAVVALVPARRARVRGGR